MFSLSLRKFGFLEKHDDPMFSLHLMIADMLGYIPSTSNIIVNVDNYVMRDCLRKNNC